MRQLRLCVAFCIVVNAFLAVREARAQWTIGPYDVVTVNYHHGNYSYTPSGGTVGGHCEADSTPTSGTCDISVTYSRSYSAPSGTGNLEVDPGCDLYGTVTGMGTAVNNTGWTWNGTRRSAGGSTYDTGAWPGPVYLHDGGDSELFFTVDASSYVGGNAYGVAGSTGYLDSP